MLSVGLGCCLFLWLSSDWSLARSAGARFKRGQEAHAGAAAEFDRLKRGPANEANAAEARERRLTMTRYSSARGRRLLNEGEQSAGAWRHLGPQGEWVQTRFDHGAVSADGVKLFGGARGLGLMRRVEDEWRLVRRGDGGAVAFDPRDGEVVYAAPSGLAVGKSRDGGATFVEAVNGLNDAGLFIAPLVIDPHDTQRLWTGGRSLWRTDDGAEHWQRASRELGGTEAARVSAIAVAPGDGNRLLAGTSEGEIYWTVNALAAGPGDLWPVVRPRAGFVSSLTFDPANGQTAYATYATWGGAHVWRSVDGGASWLALDGGLPDMPVHCLVVDPLASERLWIGTDLGVFVSVDGGQTWMAEQTGFDETPVESLAVSATESGSSLFAFTSGRGVWSVAVARADEPEQQCSYTLAPTSARFEAAGGTASVAVTAAGTNCNWTATTADAWITINSGTPGSGAGAVAYTVAANTTSAARRGAMTIAGVTFPVFQAGTGGSCNATPITPGQQVTGNLSDADCQSRRGTPGDRYSFNGRTGELIAIGMGGFDTYLILIGPDGTTIAEDDDGGGSNFNSRIPSGSGFLALPATGTYIIEAAAYSGGRGSYFLLLTQVPPGCTNYSIAPASQSFEANGGAGSVNVATGDGCTWTATSNAPWITINPGSASASGSRAASFAVAANPGAGYRNGTLTIAGQTFTVEQAGTGGSCAVTPIVGGQTVNANLNQGDCRGRFGSSNYLDRYSFTAAAGDQVAITPSSSFTPFLSLRAPNGTEIINGVSRLPANGFINLPLSGTYLIEFTSNSSSTSGDYTLNLLIAPGGCGFAISAARQGFEFGGGTGQVTVAAGSGCVWSVVNPANWITINAGASGIGAGAVAYTVAANNSVNARSATLVVAGQSYLVEQAGVGGGCGVTALVNGQAANGSLSNADCRSRFRNSYVERYTFNASAGEQASLLASSPAFTPRIHLLAPDGSLLAENFQRVPSGAGFLPLPATGAYTVEVTSDSDFRSGDYTLLLTLAGSGCGYAISPASRSYEFGGGAGQINVTAASGCAWRAVSNVAWVTITTGATGAGNGAVNFTVAVNNSTSYRSGALTVAGQSFTIEQAGVGGSCVITPLTAGQTVNGSLTNADCRSRVNLSSTYYADRYSFIATAGQQLTALLPSSTFAPNLYLTAPDGSFFSSGASRLPSSGPPITLPATGTYLLEVTSSSSSSSGDYTFQLILAPGGCGFALMPARQTFEASGGTGEFAVGAGGGCPWTATSNVPWLTVTAGATGTGGGTARYMAAANTSGSYRTGTLTVAGLIFTVEQAGVGGGCNVTPITLGQAVSGNLSSADCRASFSVNYYADRYSFSGTAGDLIAITATSPQFTPQIQLFAPNGALLANASGSRLPSGTGFLTLPATGVYQIEFTSNFSFSSGSYSFTVGAPTSCAYAVLPASQTLEAAGGAATVNVLTGASCAWTASVNANTPWITISSGAAGSGPGMVSLTVAANAGNGFRSGAVTIAGQTFTIEQAGTGGRCGATEIAAGQLSSGSVAGNLNDGDCRSRFRTSSTYYADRYTFTATAGQQAAILTASAPFTLFFTLVGPNDAALASDFFRLPASSGFVLLPASGTYTLEVTSGSSFQGGDYTFSLAFAPGGCGYTLAPASQTFEFAGGASMVNVTAAGGCAWQAVSNVPWITFTGSASGAGNGALAFTVATNTTSGGRRGLINITGQSVAIEQAGVGGSCATMPLVVGQLASGNIGGSDCVSRFRTGATYYADRYSFTATAGQQAAISLPSSAFTPAIYLVAPDGSLLASGGGRLPSGNDLLSLPQTGTYLLEVTTSFSSSGGDYTLNLALGPPGCSYAVAPARQTFEFAGGMATVNVTAASGCAWQAVSNTPWITISTGASGAGDGSVNYAAAINTGSGARRGTITVAGQVVTIEQAGVGGECATTPLSGNVNGNLSGGDCLSRFRVSGSSAFYAERYSFTATAGQQIALLAQSPGFLPYLYLVTPGGAVLAEGVGRLPASGVLTLPASGTYLLEVTSRDSFATGDFALTLSQFSAGCGYALSATNQTFEFAGGTGSVNVVAASGCAWQAVTSASWITINAGVSGAGNGAVAFTVAAHTGANARSGTLVIAGQTFTIEQSAAGGNCNVAPITPGQTINGSLSSGDCLARFRTGNTFYADRYLFTATAGDRVAISLTAAAGSSFTPYLSLVGQAGAPIAQNNGGASANGGGIPPGSGFFVLPASGVYSIEATSASAGATGNYALTLTLQPPCLTISPATRAIGPEGGSGNVTITAPAGCDWTAATTAGWLTITAGTSGAGNGTVAYTVAPNPGAAPRTGSLIIGGRLFTVTQANSLVSVSAASFSGAEVAPDSILAAFGANLAAATQAATTLPLPTTLGGVTIRIRDSLGVERLAPLFFVAPGQVNYLVPSGVAVGLATVTLTSDSGRQALGAIQIAPVAPALFTANANGQGVAAAVALRVRGEQQTFEPVAQFDATQGRFVLTPIDLGPDSDQVFLIMFGAGFRARSSLSAVTLKIGGVDAPVLFAGAAPGFVGLDQVNAGPLPRSLAGRGEVDVVLTVDGKVANTTLISFK
jgi:uncharacterized protein (TIGR03437 family)